MRLISLLLLVVMVSCKKKQEEPVVLASELSNGMLVLCEGLFQQNNSTLSWIDFASGSVNNEAFSAKVGRQLGDTGNDLKRYGAKVYVVVNNSSTIEVLEAKSLNFVKQIEMIQGGTAKQPRNITFANGKAYVTCFDGYVDVIDTTSLTIETRIAVGSNPEGIVISNDKLFVSNSGGLNNPMDSTVSVIDLNSQMEVKKIIVGLNPGELITDSQGEVYVISRGDYGAIESKLVRIDPTNEVVLQSFAIPTTDIERMNNQFLIANYNYATSQSSVGLFDPITEALITSNYINVSGVNTLYGIHYNSHMSLIYLMDAMSFTNTGYVRAYTTSGTNVANYHVGLNPSKVLMYE